MLGKRIISLGLGIALSASIFISGGTADVEARSRCYYKNYNRAKVTYCRSIFGYDNYVKILNKYEERLDSAYKSGDISQKYYEWVKKYLKVRKDCLNKYFKQTEKVKEEIPAKLIKPAKPIKPTKPEKNKIPAIPLKPAKPVKPTKPGKVTIPAIPIKPAKPVKPTENNKEVTAEEQKMVDLVNKERVAKGLKSLKIDNQLTKLARLKSKDMIAKDYFAHTSPTYGSPFDMMKKYGVKYTYAGENLAGNQTVDKAHVALMNSDGHRKNILSPNYTHIGIGIVKGGKYGTMYTQMFIKK